MSQPEGVRGSWERKVHPELSGVELLGRIVANKILQVREAMNNKEELVNNFEEELWRYRFNKCVKEMRDSLREEDILNKDVMLRELEYFHGPKMERLELVYLTPMQALKLPEDYTQEDMVRAIREANGVFNDEPVVIQYIKAEDLMIRGVPVDENGQPRPDENDTRRVAGVPRTEDKDLESSTKD
jgi:hypothetical protein